MTDVLTPLIDVALTVAREAGALLVEGYRTRPQAREKARSDLVTEFDLSSEAHIKKRLAELTPNIPVVAEEHGDVPIDELAWYCDPLDGTTNFVHGHPYFSVSIGLMKAEEPLLGVVHAPALELTWTGARGTASMRNGQPCRVSDTQKLEHALLATGFPPDRSRSPHNNFDAFVSAMRAVRGVRRCGSAAIDLCLVADGTYDGYWERALHAWDLVAGAAVVLSAQGTVTSLDGTAARLSVGHLVASNGALHTQLLELLGEQPLRLP